jgi:hypothetical protein
LFRYFFRSGSNHSPGCCVSTKTDISVSFAWRSVYEGSLSEVTSQTIEISGSIWNTFTMKTLFLSPLRNEVLMWTTRSSIKPAALRRYWPANRFLTFFFFFLPNVHHYNEMEYPKHPTIITAGWWCERSLVWILCASFIRLSQLLMTNIEKVWISRRRELYIYNRYIISGTKTAKRVQHFEIIFLIIFQTNLFSTLIRWSGLAFLQNTVAAMLFILFFLYIFQVIAI